MSDVDVVAGILVTELEAGAAHARIVAKEIMNRLFGAGASDVDEPLEEATVLDGHCSACGQTVIDFGTLSYDRDRAEIRYKGKRCSSMTGKESALFEYFLAKRGVAARKESILDHLYQLDPGRQPEIKIIDVFVCKLRAKIKPLGLEIATVWGKGYYLKEPLP